MEDISLGCTVEKDKLKMSLLSALRRVLQGQIVYDIKGYDTVSKPNVIILAYHIKRRSESS